MAHIKINKKEFDKLIGREISEEYLEDKASFMGVHWNHVEGKKWDVEVYPNRPDLLSVEGLARAYRGYKDIDEGLEDYSPKIAEIEVEIDDSVEKVRPHIGCAVIRDIELTERIINGMIQLQEKLHQTMGRQRDKLAIGLHDLEQLEPPFVYEAVEPEKVSFTPLEYDREMGLGEILDEHEKGQKYAWILENEEKYPIIKDSNDQVLSFPPIINNQLTEVETDTQDIFVDVTGKDRETVQKALNILVTALAERDGDIEKVIVDGEEMPDLSPEQRILDTDYLRQVSGLDLSDREIAERLEMMKYGARETKKGIKTKVPSYRNDIMHDYDLIEDVVIAHQYDNIEPELPDIDQIAEEKTEEEYAQLFREILHGTGALEAHTYSLSNREKLFDRMELKNQEVAEMDNALTEDYTAVRNWLLPSLFEVLERNRHRSYPQKFFETAEVVELDDSATGASNRMKAAYVHTEKDAGFTDARQVLQVIGRDLGVEFEVEKTSKRCFRKDRAGKIMLEERKVGVIGEFSEQVAENWGLEHSVTGFELDLEKISEMIAE